VTRVFTDAKRLVVKVGSSLVTDDGRGLDHAAVARWAEEIAQLISWLELPRSKTKSLRAVKSFTFFPCRRTWIQIIER